MGHLLAPLVWTDILTSVSEGVASQFMPLYRSLLLDDDKDGDVGALLQETVMGCDSTTVRLLHPSELTPRGLSLPRPSHSPSGRRKRSALAVCPSELSSNEGG